MPVCPIPYPLPAAALLTVHPERLALSAVTTLRHVYGVELDYAPESLDRLDAVLCDRLRSGHYRQDDFPAMLSLSIGAYLGQVLLRAVPGGHWGMHEENLFVTPLPFLVFSQQEFERQINIVEDVMSYLWSGQGITPGTSVKRWITELTRDSKA